MYWEVFLNRFTWIHGHSVKSEEAYSSTEQEPPTAAKKLPPISAHWLLWNDTHKV